MRIEVVDGTLRIKTMKDVKDKVRALARSSGLADKASVEKFLAWRDDERKGEAG